jgi:hypothetical protein
MADNVFDDASEVTLVSEEDEPPTGGVWGDSEEFLHNPTKEELAEGERLGREIDADDDEDNGL